MDVTIHLQKVTCNLCNINYSDKNLYGVSKKFEIKSFFINFMKIFKYIFIINKTKSLYP
jgi:hypothetical protein